MNIRWAKLRPDAVQPYSAHETDAGYDFTIIQAIPSVDWNHKPAIICPTGIALEIPVGFFMALILRSSSWKYGIRLANQIGVIDCEYRGEITLAFRLDNPELIDQVSAEIVGKRIVQGIILPCLNVSLTLVESLESTKRGDGGFGSTGQ